ncbi:uncharacterized protein LOC113649968 [Tachysurus ichikawai]
MKLDLFLLCLTGVVLITLQDVRHGYFLITTPMTWDDANTYCYTNYESLAVVETADDWYRLTAEANRHGLTVTGWIGLYNQVNNWKWTLYGPPMNITASYWPSGQPDNYGGNEACVRMDTNGYWFDNPCSVLNPFICYNATIKGFIAIPSPELSWGESRDYCLTYHTDLASPKDETQNNEIQQYVSPQGASWIGIFRPSWIWVNGDDGSGLPWYPGNPNNVDGDDNCGFLNNSLLEDKPCNSQFYFFCHISNTVRQQVLKLKIKGDNSVFGPASQAAILQQVKQKLKDHGIERETNVTWRVWPDGTIVHKKSKNEL